MTVDVEWIAAVVLFAALLIFGAWGAVTAILKTYQTTEEIEEEWDAVAASETEEVPLIERHVYVLEKTCTSTVEGIKYPVCRNTYTLIVRTDDGETVAYDVDHEIWLTVRELRFGTLAFVGDRVYGYCED